MLNLSIVQLDTSTGFFETLFECIHDFESAELLTQLVMNQKQDINKLVFISTGFNRGIKDEELEKAMCLAEKHKCE